MEDEYRPLAPDAQGILQSRTFPGLWLDSAALVALDGVRMMAVLRTGLEHPDHAALVARLAGARSA